MISELGYPKEMISVEKRLSSIPHLIHQRVPNRRYDLICFAKNLSDEHSIYPLIMIECKAHPITKAALQQIIGYNDYVAAYFIAVANGERVMVGYQSEEGQGYQFFEGLPSYEELLQMVRLGCKSEK